jgi:hypothetical protein
MTRRWEGELAETGREIIDKTEIDDTYDTQTQTKT